MYDELQSPGERVLGATEELIQTVRTLGLSEQQKNEIIRKITEIAEGIPENGIKCDDTADHCDEVHASTQLETGERDSVPIVHMDKHLQVVRDRLDTLQLMFLEERRRASEYEASATEAWGLLAHQTTDHGHKNGTVEKDDCHENCRHACEEMVELRNQLRQFAAAFAAFSVAFNTDRN